MGSHGKKDKEKAKSRRTKIEENRKDIAQLQEKIKAMISKRAGGGAGGAQK
jgi:hypothetical protein